MTSTVTAMNIGRINAETPSVEPARRRAAARGAEGKSYHLMELKQSGKQMARSQGSCTKLEVYSHEESCTWGCSGSHPFTCCRVRGTLTVPSPYPTIQAAINASVNGDTVLVDDGVYVEYIDFLDRVITVESVNGALSTAIQSPPPVNQRPVVRFYNNGSGSALNGFTISGGYAQDGGGIYIYNSAPTIRRCSITGNYATYSGGGIYISTNLLDAVVLEDCYIQGNSTMLGPGGLSLTAPSLRITNCVISGNRASQSGPGGLAISSASATISNSTIAGNWSATAGGGLGINGNITVVNSILWQNWSNLGYYHEIYNASGASVFTYSDIDQHDNGAGPPWPGLGNINAIPDFVSHVPAESAPTPLGDYHLQGTSPCLDNGTASGAPAFDIDRQSRPQGLGYDRGADEYSAMQDSIVITKALYDYILNTLTVEATSSLGAGGNLTLWGIGNMTWDSKKRKWVKTTTVELPPSVITVCGAAEACTNR